MKDQMKKRKRKKVSQHTCPLLKLAKLLMKFNNQNILYNNKKRILMKSNRFSQHLQCFISFEMGANRNRMMRLKDRIKVFMMERLRKVCKKFHKIQMKTKKAWRKRSHWFMHRSKARVRARIRVSSVLRRRQCWKRKDNRKLRRPKSWDLIKSCIWRRKFHSMTISQWMKLKKRQKRNSKTLKL